MELIKDAMAGTLESSDLLVKVAPADTLEINIQSLVIKQFGTAIRQTVTETLNELSISKGSVIVDDKGALDCVIKARVQAAVLRGADCGDLDWGKLS